MAPGFSGLWAAGALYQLNVWPLWPGAPGRGAIGGRPGPRRPRRRLELLDLCQAVEPAQVCRADRKQQVHHRPDGRVLWKLGPAVLKVRKTPLGRVQTAPGAHASPQGGGALVRESTAFIRSAGRPANTALSSAVR